MLSLLPVILVKADVSHAKQALELHAYGLEIFSKSNALGEIILGHLDIAFE